MDEVGHGEVHDVVFPRQLQDDVGVQEVVTLKQARREAVVSLKKEQQSIFKRTFQYRLEPFYGLGFPSYRSFIAFHFDFLGRSTFLKVA